MDGSALNIFKQFQTCETFWLRPGNLNKQPSQIFAESGHPFPIFGHQCPPAACCHAPDSRSSQRCLKKYACQIEPTPHHTTPISMDMQGQTNLANPSYTALVPATLCSRSLSVVVMFGSGVWLLGCSGTHLPGWAALKSPKKHMTVSQVKMRACNFSLQIVASDLLLLGLFLSSSGFHTRVAFNMLWDVVRLSQDPSRLSLSTTPYDNII